MLPRCKNKWRTLFMGPAQPWHYKMGEANLFCLRQPGPHAARLRCRAPALMWGHPRKKDTLAPHLGSACTPHEADTSRYLTRKSYRWLNYGNLCFAQSWGQERKEEKQQQQHCGPKSTECRGLWIRPYVQYVMWELQTNNRCGHWAARRERKRNNKHWARLAEAIEEVKCADTFPAHRHIGGPCFYQANEGEK